MRPFLRPVLFGLGIALALGFSLSAGAAGTGLRVMSFNVMCSFCGHNGEIGRFKKRLPQIADTIDRHDPDLISVQELFTRSQMRRLRRRLKTEYETVFAHAIVGYADPTLFVRKSRFRVLDRGGFWLGPNAPRFGFGWAIAYPRRVEWADLEDLTSGRRFRFVGTHFDNNPKNKEPSAELLVRTVLPGGATGLPVVFAGDTNLRPSMEGYATLARAFRDTFTEVEDHPFIAKGPTSNSDGCDLDPTAVFPDCRIDHVMLSPNAPWRTKAWRLDAFKYAKGFTSDHRAVIVDLATE
ncbi:MAG: endonuclease/exonuclease/phosphatase family protein [Bdellovibrionales bacterium]|nr:endonuclease/exonuclease/phosphatase family protein [Bdellovibrionales bacterium]